MKKQLLLTLALLLPLSQIARADNDENDNNQKKRHHQEEAARRAQAVRRSGTPVAQPAERGAAQFQRPGSAYRAPVAPQRSYGVPGQPYNYRPSTNRGTANTLGRNGDPGYSNTRANYSRSENRINRPTRSFDRNSFSVARSRVIRTYHDRGWWTSHYHTTFVLFGGGYYYWDSGYWFPAYGYSPIYNSYAYNEPIYGYNNLAPGQVLENVQLALRDLGYYHGEIDGLIGPETRDALAAYQRDNGLVETAAVDEPTLVTLGLA